jgi:PIN domain nuclease of toxin-antitoxin system
VRLLLDTVAFLWALEDPQRMSAAAMSALANSRAVREISALSLSEIAIKAALGKLRVQKSDIMDGLADLRLRVLPYTAEHAGRFFDLPPHHDDPFDRQIIAQALAEDVPVVTPDSAFRIYKGVRVIW